MTFKQMGRRSSWCDGISFEGNEASRIFSCEFVLAMIGFSSIALGAGR